jgi:serine/threonine protein kinase
MEHISRVLARYFPEGRVSRITELTSGNVHDTYLVSLDSGDKKMILQRINDKVFRQPDLLMENMLRVNEYLSQQYRRDGHEAGRGLEPVHHCRTLDGRDYVIDENGCYWRGLEYIGGAVAYDRIENAEHALEAGRALGIFHRLLAGLEQKTLHDILPGFHRVPEYLAQYDRVLSACGAAASTEAEFCRAFIQERRKWASVLEDARRDNILRQRIIHGDPKISNVLIDDKDGRARALIDLDTVSAGLIHYDIGDCLRSCCNTSGEETTSFTEVAFDLTLCRRILTGYKAGAAAILDRHDVVYMYDCIRLLAFELGLRFFTDHLAGDRYFKVAYRGHNLSRAMVQFVLTLSIEKQETAIRDLCDQLFFNGGERAFLEA